MRIHSRIITLNIAIKFSFYMNSFLTWKYFSQRKTSPHRKTFPFQEWVSSGNVFIERLL